MRVGTTTAITGSGAGIATGVWKHYALAREGTNTRLFVDGTQRGIKTSDTTDYGASKGLVIGADFDGASQNVTGWIDDFRIERELLSTLQTSLLRPLHTQVIRTQFSYSPLMAQVA